MRHLNHLPIWRDANCLMLEVEQAREWMLTFVHWYNEEHRHSALKYVTPAQRHRGEATRILANRKATYQRARDAHPERWAGAIRDFGLPKAVALNPETAANC